MSDGITINYDRFDAALTRRLLTGTRDFQPVAEQAVKGVVRHLIAITPPAHQGVTGGAARAHGASLVRSDIRSIYGTAREAYDAIRDKDAGQAKAFWRHHSMQDTAAANVIARKVIGKGLHAFDGGKVHQSFKKGRARGKSRDIVFYVTDKRPLEAYVREIQSRVGWLAGGWNAAAGKLGIQPQQWIWKHDSPGSAEIEITEGRIRIRVTNSVSYATEADGARRLQWALDAQSDDMERAYRNYLETKFVPALAAALT